jgi:hypothetical protein
MNTNDIIYLLQEASNESDTNNIIINSDYNSDNIVIFFNNFEYSKNKIKYYLEKKRKKLYDKLDKLYDILIKDNFPYIKDVYIEYFNDIYYFYHNFYKDICNITHEDNFNYKFIEIKNNIKYEYNKLKISLY